MGPTEAGAHPVLRQIVMTPDIRSEVNRQLAFQTAPF